MTRRARGLAALVLTGGLLLAGCGDDDDSVDVTDTTAGEEMSDETMAGEEMTDETMADEEMSDESMADEG